MFDQNALDKRGQYILRQKVFSEKIIQNCLKIDATGSYNNALLQRQETKTNTLCPGSWYNNN